MTSYVMIERKNTTCQPASSFCVHVPLTSTTADTSSLCACRTFGGAISPPDDSASDRTGIDKETSTLAAFAATQSDSTRSTAPARRCANADAASAAFPGEPVRSSTPDVASAAQRKDSEFTALRVRGNWLTGMCPAGCGSDSMLQMARITADRFLSLGSRVSNTASVTNKLH